MGERRGTFQDVAEALALSLANLITINANLGSFKPEDHDAAVEALSIDIEQAMAVIVMGGVQGTTSAKSDNQPHEWIVRAQVKSLTATGHTTFLPLEWYVFANDEEEARTMFNRVYVSTFERQYTIQRIDRTDLDCKCGK